MTRLFQSLTNKIKEVEAIKTSAELMYYVEKIEKLSATNEQSAYFLGQFFKHKFDPDRLPASIHKELRQTIRKEQVKKYYYLKEKPENEIDVLGYMFLLAGIIAVVFGVVRLFDGSVVVSRNLRYLGMIFNNGGYSIILGLVLSLSGFIRLRHTKKTNALIRGLKLD
jgi:hypothetical protein